MPVPTPDRRSNLVLRVVVDDMLERVRMLNRESMRLTDHEREMAEKDLEEVMGRVRRMAVQGPRQ